MRMPFAILLVATALAAIPGTALAKNGDRGTTTTPPAPTNPAPTTPAPTSPTPTTPTPTAPAAPCLELTARDGGTSPGELRFEAVNCGSSSLTFTSSVTDTAWRVLYPDWSCGTATYAGPKLTVAAGRSADFSIATRRGTCTVGSAEAHSLEFTAFAADGSTLATAFTSWQERVATASR